MNAQVLRSDGAGGSGDGISGAIGRVFSGRWLRVGPTVSMYPALCPGDSVRISPGRRVRRGDIVTFLTGGRLTAHRVVRIRSSGDRRRYLVKGDNMPAADGWLDQSCVLGVVTMKRCGEAEVSFDSPALRLAGLLSVWTYGLLSRLHPPARRVAERVLKRACLLIQLRASAKGKSFSHGTPTSGV